MWIFLPTTSPQNRNTLLALTQLDWGIDRLGLVILNSLGQIELITTLAIGYLENYFPDATIGSYLPDLLWAWVKQQIDPSRDSQLAGQRLPLRIERDGKQLTIRTISAPAEDHYLLLMEEQTLDLRSRLELLGLSQRETEVLSLLMRGENNQAIANQIGVGISTVRKHLERIFAKLGVQSRTEAIARVLVRLGFFDNTPFG